MAVGLAKRGTKVVNVSPGWIENREHKTEVSLLPEPALLRAARQIYRSYYDAHPKLVQRPIGVAINRVTYRGKLIFTGKPVLLPQETFVPFNQIESELY